jgi:hypothetical protein
MTVVYDILREDAVIGYARSMEIFAERTGRALQQHPVRAWLSEHRDEVVAGLDLTPLFDDAELGIVRDILRDDAAIGYVRFMEIFKERSGRAAFASRPNMAAGASS